MTSSTLLNLVVEIRKALIMYRRTYRRRRYAKRASRYGRRLKRTAGINLRNKSGITAAAKLPASNTRTIAIVKESNNFVMQMGVKAPNV